MSALFSGHHIKAADVAEIVANAKIVEGYLNAVQRRSGMSDYDQAATSSSKKATPPPPAATYSRQPNVSTRRLARGSLGLDPVRSSEHPRFAAAEQPAKFIEVQCSSIGRARLAPQEGPRRPKPSYQAVKDHARHYSGLGRARQGRKRGPQQMAMWTLPTTAASTLAWINENQVGAS
jgi:hypothetical protein